MQKQKSISRGMNKRIRVSKFTEERLQRISEKTGYGYTTIINLGLDAMVANGITEYK